MKKKLCVLVISAILSVVNGSNPEEDANTLLPRTENVYCISNTTASACLPECSACDTLSNASQDFFVSNTTIFILPGNHTLDHGIAVTNVSELWIIGGLYPHSYNTEGHSVIHCTGQGGFVFGNSSRVTLESIALVNCGQQINSTKSHYTWSPPNGYAALTFNTVWNISLLGITVSNSNGYGLYSESLLGKSVISNCIFTHNHGNANHGGGNVLICQFSCPVMDKVSSLLIANSEFLYGWDGYSNPVATGLSMFLQCNLFNVNITDSKFIGNVAISAKPKLGTANVSTGGNLGIFFRNYYNIVSNIVHISHCVVSNGSAHRGAGVYVNILERPRECQTTSFNPPQQLYISHTQFTENHAIENGGGMFVTIHEVSHVCNITGTIQIDHCRFNNNTSQSPINSGIGLTIVSLYLPGYLQHWSPQFSITIKNCVFFGNVFLLPETRENELPDTSGTVFLKQVTSGANFVNCTFAYNNSTALTLLQSIIVLQGNITIKRNTARDGAGMALCGNSFIYLKANTHVEFIENHALRYGGGIYSEAKCLQTYSLCFYQLHRDVLQGDKHVDCTFKYNNCTFDYDNRTLETIHLYFVNNVAEVAGSAIYGNTGNCFSQKYEFHLPPGGSILFEKLFTFVNKSHDHSSITSPPIGVCLCEDIGNTSLSEISHPNCSLKSLSRPIVKYPGESFSVPAVVVGQENGAVPGIVQAEIINATAGNASLSNSDNLQLINSTRCTFLNYTIFSSKQVEIIKLDESSPGMNNYESPNIEIHLKHCPAGFTLTGAPSYCDCFPILKNNTYKCNITNQFIIRKYPNWIGFLNNKREVILGQYCPYNFCLEESVPLAVNHTTIDQDSQCAFNHSGILCGGCLKGLSLSLGSSECVSCSNIYILLIVVFAIAGIILVLFLTLCNLTISEGTINGIIFYANVVHINSQTFFSKEKPLVAFQVFIAWLNLDFGIKTCFYNGMDAYAKAWLQFVFPVYLWLIAGLIIFFSHKSIAVSRIVGRNAVKVLATLFFLSYAKLLRAIIVAMAPIVLVYGSENGTEYRSLVWEYDGSVAFLSEKHIPLFIVAVAFGLFTLPYSIVLTFIQCLQRGSHTRPLFWVRKLKPFFDAYTGPYKDKSRFWTGYLLLLRCSALCCFALNAYGNPQINIMTTTLVCLFVIIPAWVLGGVYQKRWLDAIESISFLNLSLLSSTTACFQQNLEVMNTLTAVSVSVEVVLVVVILFYHTFSLFPVIKLKLFAFITHLQNHQRQPDSVSLQVQTLPRISDNREPLLSSSEC